MAAERLRQLSELRRMQPYRERPARRNRFSARSRADRFHQRALGVVHLRFVEDGQAWRRALGGHGFILVEAGEVGMVGDFDYHSRKWIAKPRGRMMIENRLKVFVVALGLGLLAGPALADAIDGK